MSFRVMFLLGETVVMDIAEEHRRPQRYVGAEIHPTPYVITVIIAVARLQVEAAFCKEESGNGCRLDAGVSFFY